MAVDTLGEERYFHVPLYNLVPPPGVAAKLGFAVLNVPVTIELGVNPDPPTTSKPTSPRSPRPPTSTAPS